ncbi:ABC-type dipeptide/oligopeptide/nickel transport system permease subunit [Azospirillum fermentarium]|uniref:hypothetical protein n=1 Tax=Azospirillum fermentarium TaxID=1233114 RepID=UPI0022278BDD|nr:hypothetical protein [Azospirillum fermentarium]MCW2245182.1 ABC-type dipeptide/oligopeptide/nickel transport system permease subunit [Azospirillum fermentarium]
MDGLAGDGFGVPPWRAAWRGFRASRAGVHGLGALAAVCCGGLLEPVLSAGAPTAGGVGDAVVTALDAVAASLLLGLAAAVLAAVAALLWGGGAALAGGRGMRLVTLAGFLGALPLPLLPLMAGGLLDADLLLFTVVLGLAAAPVPALAVHGVTAAALRSDMAAAAQAAGLSRGALLGRRVLPAVAVPLLAACWGAWPRALAMEGFAGLVHLGPVRGAGEAATWGSLLGDAVAGGGPLDLLGPGLLLAVTLWALGAIGEGLAHAAAAAVPGVSLSAAGRREGP